MISLGDALFGKTQQKLLALLFGTPERSFYTREILDSVKAGRGSVQRELERMAAAELLVVSRIGNQIHYQANSACPIFSELASLVRKTFGIADVIRQAINPMEAQIQSAFVYGSTAKGGARADSDIDLMLIGRDLAYGQVMENLMNAEQQLGKTINPTIYTAEDFMAKRLAANHFLTRVLEQPRIEIIGKLPPE